MSLFKIITGLAGGLAAGLLLAKKSGKEFRKDLEGKTSEEKAKVFGKEFLSMGKNALDEISKLPENEQFIELKNLGKEKLELLSKEVQDSGKEKMNELFPKIEKTLNEMKKKGGKIIDKKISDTKKVSGQKIDEAKKSVKKILKKI